MLFGEFWRFLGDCGNIFGICLMCLGNLVVRFRNFE